MTKDFTIPPRPWSPNGNGYVDEVHNIFYQHWIVLKNERQVAIDEINKWRHDWEERINKYAHEQISVLDNNYNCLRCTFDEKHRESLDLANVYYSAQKLDLFNELRDACQLLTFQIAVLKTVKYEMERPEVIIIEKQMEKQDSEERNRNNRDARRRRRQKKDNQNTAENTSDASVSTPHNQSTSDLKPARTRSSRRPEKKNDQSIDNKDDSKNQVMNGDDSNNKCPICFMIFPLSMTHGDRRQHVNEHMVDGEDTF